LKVMAHAHLGERAQCETALAQALEHFDNFDLDARVDLAGAYCLMVRLDEAIDLLIPALAEQPDHALALARLGWCRWQQGEMATARQLYQQSTAIAPYRLPVWSALARLALAEQDVRAAQEALDSANAQLAKVQIKLPENVLNLFAHQLRGLQLEIWVESSGVAEAEEWLATQREQLAEEEWIDFVSGYATLLAGKSRHASAEESLREALKHYPENSTLIMQLAELAQLQGRTQQTIHLLRRLIVLAKKREEPQVTYWVRLANACSNGLDEQARKAAETAMEQAEALIESDTLRPAMIAHLRLQAKNALARVESQAQHFELAEKLFNEVLQQNPQFLPALQDFGQHRMIRGQIDEAIALFERIKQIDPAKGYASLINARHFPEDEATLERIEMAARQPTLEGPVRAGLLLQLSSAHEKRKAYEKAFQLAHEANETNKPLLHYDAKAHRQRCARIRHAFCKALFEHRKACGYRGEDESLPVFVLGMPRSGTTLVEQIIASHGQIFGAGELGIIPSRIQGLNRWERHTGSGRRYPDCVDDLTPYVVENLAKGIIGELKELAAEDKPEARHIVDKLPHNFENIGLIKFLFPKAKIISVRRDPRDIALSNYFTDYAAKHGGMGFAYDMEWIGQQLADHNLLMHHWHQLFPGEILEIAYEEVVENTEVVAKKMLDYIGVTWDEQVLAFNELDRPVKTASVWQVRQPIYKTSKAKWRRYQSHLAELIKGTNGKIEWEPIEDMLTLPEPGFLTDGVALFKEGKLDEAEYGFKKLLHHNPEHAAAHYMVGLIYLNKRHMEDGIAEIEQALGVCPWQGEWRDNLIRAYEVTGQPERISELKPQQRALAEDEPALDEPWAQTPSGPAESALP
jgi:tetratricopeptide (TPR) repeat protein